MGTTAFATYGNYIYMGTSYGNYCIRPSSHQTPNLREKSHLLVYTVHLEPASPKSVVSSVEKIILYWNAKITDFILYEFQHHDYIMSSAKCAHSEVSFHNISYLNSTKFDNGWGILSPLLSYPFSSNLEKLEKLEITTLQTNSLAGLSVIWETKGRQEDLMTEVPTYT